MAYLEQFNTFLEAKAVNLELMPPEINDPRILSEFENFKLSVVNARDIRSQERYKKTLNDPDWQHPSNHTKSTYERMYIAASVTIRDQMVALNINEFNSCALNVQSVIDSAQETLAKEDCDPINLEHFRNRLDRAVGHLDEARREVAAVKVAVFPF